MKETSLFCLLQIASSDQGTAKNLAQATNVYKRDIQPNTNYIERQTFSLSSLGSLYGSLLTLRVRIDSMGLLMFNKSSNISTNRWVSEVDGSSFNARALAKEPLKT